MAGSPRAIGKRITTTHNRTREDARTTLCALSSCLYIRKGKSNTSNKDKAGKTRKENKQKTTGAKQEKERQRTKRKANKEITGQTRHKPYSRLTIHAHKRPTIHAKHPSNTTPHKTRETPPNPLKRQIKPYLQAMHQGKSREGGQNAGTHDQRTRANLWQVLKPEACTSGHAKMQTSRATPAPLCPTFQIYLCFSPLSVSQIPDKTQKRANKC